MFISTWLFPHPFSVGKVAAGHASTKGLPALLMQNMTRSVFCLPPSMVLQDHQSLGGQQGMGDASSLRQPEGEDLLGQEGCDGGESTRILPWSKEELEQGEGGVKRVELAPQKNADAERRGASKHVAFAVDAALEAPSVSTLLAKLTLFSVLFLACRIKPRVAVAILLPKFDPFSDKDGFTDRLSACCLRRFVFLSSSCLHLLRV